VHVRVHAIGKRMPAWVQEGVDTYQKRLPSAWKFGVREWAQSTAAEVDKRKAQEADCLLGDSTKRTCIVALDERGKALTTREFAKSLDDWQMQGDALVFLIGGPDGLHQRCRDAATQTLSLSRLTLPHPLVRVVFTEQLYRAYSILSGHPYHRD